MEEGTTETQRSQCALAVPRLVRVASPLGEATGATRRNESLRGFCVSPKILGFSRLNRVHVENCSSV